MARIETPEVPPNQREQAGRALQELLADLTALALNGKQAHWHVTGRRFLPVHEQLDAIVTDARAWADLAAERSITLGITVDGRADTVARTTAVEPFPEGFVEDDKVVALVTGQLDAVTGRARAHVAGLGDADPVTQDVVIEILRGLEKHRWMLQAQLV